MKVLVYAFLFNDIFNYTNIKPIPLTNKYFTKNKKR